MPNQRTTWANCNQPGFGFLGTAMLHHFPNPAAGNPHCLTVSLLNEAFYDMGLAENRRPILNLIVTSDCYHSMAISRCPRFQADPYGVSSILRQPPYSTRSDFADKIHQNP